MMHDKRNTAMAQYRKLRKVQLIAFAILFTVSFIFPNETIGKPDKPIIYPSWIPFANVKNFGAKGDGKTDDTEAIQRAIQSGKADRELYFPAGEMPLHDISIEKVKMERGKNIFDKKEFYWNISLKQFKVAGKEFKL